MKISEELLTWLIGLTSGCLILLVLGNVLFLCFFKNRIYPQITIDHVEVGGLTYDQALSLLKKEIPPPTYHLTLAVDDIQVSSQAAELGLERNYQATLNQAYNLGRVGFPLKRLFTFIKTLIKEQNLTTQLSYNPQKIEELVVALKNQVDYPGQDPSADLNYSGVTSSLVITPGRAGRELVTTKTLELIKQEIGQAASISAQVASTSAQLKPEEQAQARVRALPLVGKRLIFKTEAVRLELNDQKLVSFLALPSGYKEAEIDSLLQSWADVVNRPAQNAIFAYDSATMAVDEFQPDRPGLALNQAETRHQIKETIEQIIEQADSNPDQGTKVGLGNRRDYELALPVQTKEAAVTLAETNDLGIKERLGLGESEYDHSIPNRVHNVKITTQKISDTLIAPGEEFSFNQTLGEVSARTGYKSAYVIRNGRTELGDGGGVCQVSTTVFRAALDAGLKITLRLPHSYRVSYYELNSKPGVDATVYAGNVDLRFVNDTDHHLLLHAEADSEELYMKVELYGTSDGRTTELKDHQVWGYTPPPPPEYYPDPSLPAGTTKQVDWAVAGAKAKFTHVIKNAQGEIVSEKTYYSHYQPWAAKYLVGPEN